MISPQFIEELKLHSDIESVMSSYVQIKRRGRNLTCLCPFHSEKTPSCTIYPDSQSFYCFGCGAGGDVITFIKRIENLEYVEAVKFLADRAGIPMPEDEYDNSAAKRRTRILEANREAARFFFSALMSEVGRGGLQYLTGRGLTMQTIRRFGLGYAPKSWDMLANHLKKKGFSMEELEAARIVVRGQRGGYYDQFRGRVMFPIIDIRGNVIAFGGRTMDEHGPKYLNSSDTPVFKKSRNLFALNIAKSVKGKPLLLAEGYMDVISLHQAGFDTAVATLGTSLTEEQARLMSQYTDQVVICYDSDGAGQTATKRAINIFDAIGLKVRVINMQGAKDPDEFIKKFGAERFQLLLDGSSNALEFEIAKIRSKYDLESADGRVNFLKEFCSFVAGINSPIERDVYVLKVANELGVDKDALQTQIQYNLKQRSRAKERREEKSLKVFAAPAGPDKVNPQRSRHLRAALAEERLLAILLKNPDYAASISARITPEEFITDFNREIYRFILGRLAQQESTDLSAFAAVFDDEQVGRIAGLLAQVNGQTCTREEADDYIRAIKQQSAVKDTKDIASMQEDEYVKYIAGLAQNKKQGDK